MMGVLFMKKRIALVFMAALIVLTLSACGKKGIEGKWKYVSGDAGEFSEYGQDFYMTFKGGKVTFDINWEKAGLTGDELNMAKALMGMMQITYKVKSETELVMSVNVMGQNSEDTVQYKLEGDKLTFDDAVFQRQ